MLASEVGTFKWVQASVGALLFYSKQTFMHNML